MNKLIMVFALMTLTTACGPAKESAPPTAIELPPSDPANRVVRTLDCSVSGTDASNRPYTVTYKLQDYSDGTTQTGCAVPVGVIQSLNCAHADQSQTTFNVYTKFGSGAGTYYAWSSRTYFFTNAHFACTETL